MPQNCSGSGKKMVSGEWEEHTVSILSALPSTHTVLSPPSVNPDLKSLVYGVGVAQGGEEEWDFVWQQYQQTSNSYEKRLFLRALARTKQPWLLSRSVFSHNTAPSLAADWAWGCFSFNEYVVLKRLLITSSCDLNWTPAVCDSTTSSPRLVLM